ncbi:MAG: prepilin-type N-terminal cleavage/methylation domain-containing protein [Candidatus Omnitrophica bacterium]|nr:prepilin-type N-terminal cleavage/methylation domain-containing protein [Candidatus Omnitrophota bacterium]
MKSAFTLIELVTTLIIIAILAALALPRFNKASEATKAKEAVAALQQIRTGERIYRTGQEFYYPHYVYHPAPESGIDTINTVLKIYLDKRAERNWDISIDTNTLNTFTAIATRTRGRNSGETITIDQEGTQGGTWSP